MGIFDLVKKILQGPQPPPRPTTFEEAVIYVSGGIDADTVSQPMYHFTGGMAVRNSLGLWDRESPLHRHMLERFGLCHADDTGAMISAAAHAHRNNLPYDPEEDARRFKVYWRAMGRDPATMEEIRDDNHSQEDQTSR